MSSKTKTTATKEEAKSTLEPKLRFPEFRDSEAWESKTLAEICHLITNGKANAQDHEEDGDYPLFDRSAVIKKSIEFMFDAESECELFCGYDETDRIHQALTALR